MESGAFARVRAGTRKVAKMEGRTHVRKAVARKEAKGKGRVAREKPEHVGRKKGGNNKLYAIIEDNSAVKTKNQLTTKKICKYGVFWKRVQMSSGKR